MTTSTPGTVTLRIKIDVDPMMRAFHDLGQSMRVVGPALRGRPVPPRKPYPKRYSGMTARKYRASRRAYRRALTAYRKATR